MEYKSNKASKILWCCIVLFFLLSIYPVYESISLTFFIILYIVVIVSLSGLICIVFSLRMVIKEDELVREGTLVNKESIKWQDIKEISGYTYCFMGKEFKVKGKNGTIIGIPPLENYQDMLNEIIARSPNVKLDDFTKQLLTKYNQQQHHSKRISN